MSLKHNPDYILCRKQPGNAVGYLCHKCDGHCPLCDSQNPNTLKLGTVCRICDVCSYQTTLHSTISQNSHKCMMCGQIAHQPNVAYYCKNCVLMGKDRDGCPRVINLGESKKDQVFQKNERR